MANIPTATNASSSAEELESLLSTLAALSKVGLEMTRHAIDVSDAIPRVIRSQVDAQVRAQVEAAVNDAVDAALAAVNASTVPAFTRSAAPTPAEMDARYPPGNNDHVAHYVVCIGRRPGLYTSSQEAEDQVCGVPDMARKKKDNRQEALLYYRAQYALGKTATVTESAPVPAVVAPRAGPSH
ncbi:hypothetical protein B0H16DRAFT_1451466 [Mycena metata]|uniref:Ribonuclease H1 N-terminal domain-containing protein n=1 Tax=Mycena metata TaxID=1033252 RepID=A0AAD7JXJ1_9AGAR|nr:hypothetical protein B0H16DRAFT_1451466 [Mycena metata]